MTVMDVDLMIEFAVINSEAEAGMPADWLLANSSVRPHQKSTKNKPARWTPDEDRFLLKNLGYLSFAEIGQRLGRSTNAIKIRQVRRQFPAPSNRPGWLTGNDAAKALGTDIHSILKLKERGILPMDVLPGIRGILSIKKLRLYMWAINPDHWIYFRVKRMQDAYLQRLVMLAQSRWDDEWWSTGRVAKYHGIKHPAVNDRILAGKIPATRWGNWFVKRSDVVGYQFIKTWFPGADAFLLRARNQGLKWEAIGRMMKLPGSRVAYRYYCLMK